MIYSCGYFPTGHEDLDTAQEAKLDTSAVAKAGAGRAAAGYRLRLGVDLYAAERYGWALESPQPTAGRAGQPDDRGSC